MFPDNRTGCQTYTIPFTVVLGKNLYILNHVEHINALPVRPSGLLVKFNDCKMQITDCRFQRLRTLSNGRRMSNVGFRITDYGLRITDYGLWSVDCGGPHVKLSSLVIMILTIHYQIVNLTPEFCSQTHCYINTLKKCE